MSSPIETIVYTRAMNWRTEIAKPTATATDFVDRIKSGLLDTYEVTSDGMNRLYFDIDGAVDCDNYSADIANQITIEGKSCLMHILEEFGIEAPNIAIATAHSASYVCNKTKKEKAKYSVRYFVDTLATKDDIKYIADCANKMCKDENSTLFQLLGNIEPFDMGIYDKNRKMRCVNTSKPGENRPLVMFEGDIKDTIITGFHAGLESIDIGREEESEAVAMASPAVAMASPAEVRVSPANATEVELYVRAGLETGMSTKLNGYPVRQTLAFILHDAMGANGEELFVEWYRGRASFTEAGARAKYKLFASATKPVKKVGIGTLIKMYKDTDLTLATEIIRTVKGTPIVSVTIEDLNRGERFIADKIAPLLQGKIMYDNGLKTWYYTTHTGLWVKSSKANEHMICLTIQDLIETEKERIWALYKAEVDDEKKKKLQKHESELTKMYASVGRRGYISQVANYLQQILSCPGFETKLDCTRGKLVFANGIYDIRTETFKLGITPDDMVSFTLSVNYKYRQHDSEKMKFVRDRFREIMNNNEAHLEYLLSSIGHAMPGDSFLEKALYFFRDGTEMGKGDNGKTFIFAILMLIFPEIVHQSDPKMLEDGYAKSHKHLCQTKNKRIVYADEGTKKKLNASLIKTIADGLFIENEIMFSTTEKIPVYYKYFMCSNHEFVVDEGENAVYNRFRPIVCASHFDRHGKRTEENPDKLEFIADPTLADRIATEYMDEVIELVLFYAHRYYTEGIPKPPQMFVDSANKTKLANDEFATALFEYYVADPKGKVAEVDILQTCQLPYKCTQPRALRDHMKRLGLKYNKDLSGLGSTIDKIQKKGGYVGLSLKQADASANTTSTDDTTHAVSDDDKDGQKQMMC